MASARLGDDVYGEDPTVNRLEAMAAGKVGKEAGLFVASGTMGNLTAILSHGNRGDEAIVGQDAHTFRSEAGSMSAIGGITPFPLETDLTGRMCLRDIESAVRPDNPHYPHSRLILVENSYGNKNGYPIPPDYFASIKEISSRYGLAVHMDGARLFNAAIALKIDAREITRHVDSVSFCLSKGLCAPVGSVLCGTAEFIHKARRIRKSLGGGMRQAGILAAAGIMALEEMVDRLAEDHRHAQMLAHGLAQIPGVIANPEDYKTNIVFFRLCDDVEMSADHVVKQLRKRANIWLSKTGNNTFRAVTHYWIGQAEVETFLGTLSEIIQ